jgi:hypothetical protein
MPGYRAGILPDFTGTMFQIIIDLKIQALTIR